MQAQMHEHTNRLVKTDDALAHVNQRINDVLECPNPRFEKLETAMNSHEASLQASHTRTTELDSLCARLDIFKATHASLQTEVNKLRYDLDTTNSRSQRNTVALESLRKRVVSTEKRREVTVFAKIEKRMGAQHEHYMDTFANMKKRLSAQLEQYIVSYASSVGTKFRKVEAELEQRMARNVISLSNRYSQPLQSLKRCLEEALQESCLPHLNRRMDIELPARASATQSSYPSTPLTSPARPSFLQGDRTKSTPGAQTALPQVVHMQQKTLPTSNSDSGSPQGAQTIMQIGELRTLSASSRNTSSNPLRHLESHPKTIISVPARPSTAVLQPSNVHQSQQDIDLPSMTVDTVHQRQEADTQIEWCVEGHAAVRLVRTRQLQELQELGEDVMDVSPQG